MDETCPHCLADLRGARIVEPCGDSKPRYYSHVIGVEIRGVYDGVLFWQCPKCEGRWHRWPRGDVRHTKAIRYVGAE